MSKGAVVHECRHVPGFGSSQTSGLSRLHVFSWTRFSTIVSLDLRNGSYLDEQPQAIVESSLI